jgi:hypothetical protein
MFRFTIRDVQWLTVVVGIAVGGFKDGGRYRPLSKKKNMDFLSGFGINMPKYYVDGSILTHSTRAASIQPESFALLSNAGVFHAAPIFGRWRWRSVGLVNIGREGDCGNSSTRSRSGSKLDGRRIGFTGGRWGACRGAYPSHARMPVENKEKDEEPRDSGSATFMDREMMTIPPDAIARRRQLQALQERKMPESKNGNAELQTAKLNDLPPMRHNPK